MYWSDRQKQLYSQLEKDEKKLNERLISFYKTEYSKLDKEIAAFYQKYGVNNIIEYRTVMEALSDKDRALLIEQMDEFAKQYPQYAHLMPVRKNIYRLNRLEGLQQSVVMHQLKIGAVNETVITEYLNKQAQRGVAATAKAMGFGTEFYFESADIIKNIVGVQWCGGKNYSERIWENTNKLAYYLTADISQGFARGENYQKLTKQLRDKFLNVNAKDAYRLIYTEGTYVMAESTMQPFTQDFEKYKISTVSDGKVCPLCADISHKVFYIKDRAAGVNFPPFHPWCRCTFEIVVDDWDAWIEDYIQNHHTDKQQAENVLKTYRNNGIINPAGKAPYGNEKLIYNPNAAYNVNIDGLSDEVNKGLSKACKRVAELGYKDNREHLELINLSNGKAEYIETGEASSVGNADFWRFLSNNTSNRYAFVHNHNTASGFSERDLSTLTEKNSVDMFVVSRYDGKVFVLESNGVIREKSFFDDVYITEMNELSSKLRSGEIEPVDRARLRETILVNNAIRDYTKGVKEFG